MAVKEIICIPHPMLREVSRPLEKMTGDLEQLINDMIATMYDAEGIGLAAVQVGELKRLLVADVDYRDEEVERHPLVMINPEIIAVSNARNIHKEGCLSIPEFYEEVERPASCTVRYVDAAWQEHQLECDGLLATCIQHEIDHLNGKLFIDYISKLKRDRVVRRFTKLKKMKEHDAQ